MAIQVVGSRAGVTSLLSLPSVLADVDRRARRVANAAGPDDHVVVSLIYRSPRTRRARSSVITSTYRGAKAQAVSHNLTRSIGAARA
jgi:hypothetical protein